MKTTLELPDGLLIQAKQAAAQLRIPLRALVEEALADRLARQPRRPARALNLTGLTVAGGLPRGMDLTSREQMHAWLQLSKTSSK